MSEVDEALSALMRTGEMTIQIVEHGVRISEEITRLVRTLYEKRANGPQIATADSTSAENDTLFWIPREELDAFRTNAGRAGITTRIVAGNQEKVGLYVPQVDLSKFFHALDRAGIRETTSEREPVLSAACDNDVPYGASAYEMHPDPEDRTWRAGRDIGVIGSTNVGERYLTFVVPGEGIADFLIAAAKQDLMCETGLERQTPFECLRDDETLQDAFIAACDLTRERKAGKVLALVRWPAMQYEPLAAANLTTDEYRQFRQDRPIGIGYAAVAFGQTIVVAFAGADEARMRPFLPPNAVVHPLVSKEDLENRLRSSVSQDAPVTVLIPAGEEKRTRDILAACGVPEVQMHVCAQATKYRERLEHRIERVKSKTQEEKDKDPLDVHRSDEHSADAHQKPQTYSPKPFAQTARSKNAVSR